MISSHYLNCAFGHELTIEAMHHLLLELGPIIKREARRD
jgi:hypothetical protein